MKFQTITLNCSGEGGSNGITVYLLALFNQNSRLLSSW